MNVYIYPHSNAHLVQVSSNSPLVEADIWNEFLQHYHNIKAFNICTPHQQKAKCTIQGAC